MKLNLYKIVDNERKVLVTYKAYVEKVLDECYKDGVLVHNASWQSRVCYF